MAEQKPKNARMSRRKPTPPKEAPEVKTEAPAEVVEEPAKEEKNPEVEALKRQIEEQNRILEMLQAQLLANKPQVVQVMADTEKITLRWQAEVADENIVDLGPGGAYGSITGPTGYASIPKSEWSKFLNASMKSLIKNRMLIVLSGMTDEEREMNGVMYKEGELLDEKAFSRMLDMGDEMIAVFPKLCHAHKEMVARRFITGFERGEATPRRRDLVVALNNLSKQDPLFPKQGAFYSIIEALNAMDAR